MTPFKMKVYTNGQQATLPKSVMEEYTICKGDYVTLKAYNKKLNDYVIFTAKVSRGGVITIPSWAVRVLWLKPGDELKAEVMKVYKVGGEEDGGTQPEPQPHIHVGVSTRQTVD